MLTCLIRMALLQCLLSPRGWVSQSFLLPSPWRHPGHEDGDDGKGYFGVPIAEWRAAARKIVRYGIMDLVAVNMGEPHRSAGALAVAKDADKDRLTADR